MVKHLKRKLIEINAKRIIRGWEHDFRKLSEKKDIKKMEIMPKLDINQLFLVPHADDELLAGYALTCLQKEKLILAYSGLTGLDTRDENKRIRKKEYDKYCSIMQCRTIDLNENNLLNTIISRENINVIYLPSVIDWHPEHRKMNYDLLEALSEEKVSNIRIMWYSVTVPIEYKRRYMVPMTKREHREKYEIFKKVYLSQSCIPLQRFQLQDRLNGLSGGQYSAECLVEIKFSLWKNMVEILKKLEPDKGLVHDFNKLKRKIDSISGIRKKSEKFYEILMETKV